MIQVLYTLVFFEMGLILALVFRTPIRKLAVMGLDSSKQGKGPLMAKTVAGTLFVVFVSSLYSVMEIQKRAMETGSVNPTDQVLLANHMLEASLMGFCMFLGLMIDRLHYYIKELNRLRNTLEAVNQQHRVIAKVEENKSVGGRKGDCRHRSLPLRSSQGSCSDSTWFLHEECQMVSLSSSNLKALSGCTKALFHYGDVRFHGNTISTPTIKGTILPGITRKSIIDVAQSQGFQFTQMEAYVWIFYKISGVLSLTWLPYLPLFRLYM
ncbi:uncharacterized protein LOC130751029 isoform X2 [Actinidia eriantha]|uniref:uncharacterized protein LOC130751029 isoform X2 n=1 Tax=Actinidia eriantha TaxID=165200 RepID=UPI00258292AB|nr:uncharacterized protein LOC130751029 isoform X2 [Actinidia eriantha]